MTYGDAIQLLYDLRFFGLKLGLANTFRLAAMAGNPHERLRFIHVAGTNGKGSTCAMLESLYRQAGLNVGLFTSPHLVQFSERIQVNRQWIGDHDVVRLVAEMQRRLEAFPADQHPTFFEVVTVMALRYFAEQQCDLVIWETGLGGRLDATNIVTPLASVITNIQFDHQKWLGDTHAKIAAEKAGIIKPGVPVVTATDEPEALDVIGRAAGAKDAPLTLVTEADARSGLAGQVALPLLGDHQKLNAALAVATAGVLQEQIAVSDEAIRRGLENVQWAGRLQLVVAGPGQSVLLDGAHNAAGADSLRAALQRHFPGIRPTLILGILQDKDWHHMCQVLAPLADRVRLVPVKSERTMAPEALRDVCAQANPEAPVLVCHSLEESLEKSRPDPFLLIAGSLYLVGEAMELLHISPANGKNERGLNEWGGSPSPEISYPDCGKDFRG